MRVELEAEYTLVRIPDGLELLGQRGTTHFGRYGDVLKIAESPILNVLAMSFATRGVAVAVRHTTRSTWASRAKWATVEESELDDGGAIKDTFRKWTATCL